jgi:hypothetical protein
MTEHRALLDALARTSASSGHSDGLPATMVVLEPAPAETNVAIDAEANVGLEVGLVVHREHARTPVLPVIN